MPLGAVAVFEYQLETVALQAGVSVMLISDGFAELFNDKGEILDYARPKENFRKSWRRVATGYHLAPN